MRNYKALNHFTGNPRLHFLISFLHRKKYLLIDISKQIFYFLTKIVLIKPVVFHFSKYPLTHCSHEYYLINFEQYKKNRCVLIHQ